jgi:AcrR family transcriptional regulator
MAIDQGRRQGRPRDTATDAAIIRAAVEVITESGAQATTLTAVAKRAGVARATVYLRWPTRSALIGAAARAAVGGQPLPLTGNLGHDIRFASAFIQRVAALPTFAAILPEIVRGVLTRPPQIAFGEVVQRRVAFGQQYRAKAAAQGLDPAIDPDLLFDMILGTAIVRLMATGRPLGVADAAQLGEVVLRGVRAATADPSGGAAGA